MEKKEPEFHTKWWKSPLGAQLTPQWIEKSDSVTHPFELERSDTISQETAWGYTMLTVASTKSERIFEFRWHVTGCGQFWLDHLTLNIMEG